MFEWPEAMCAAMGISRVASLHTENALPLAGLVTLSLWHMHMPTLEV